MPNDRYYNCTKTPAYVHSHLLTSVFSTDYQDLSGDGPSEDDLGTYTKFEYQGRNQSNDKYRWRIPFEKNMANFNEGLKSDFQDDQANYVYGEKEIHYIKKIETKTHVAIFTLSKRKDAFGVNSEEGGLDQSQYLMKLSKISLYTKPEYEKFKNDLANAEPIKEVHFEYTYDLCQGIANNNLSQQRLGNELSDELIDENDVVNKGGKLTLKKIYFTYKNSKMGKYTNYEFDYHESNPQENPKYNIKAYDSWGNYKPNLGDGSNASLPTNAEFPYVLQSSSLRDGASQKQDIYSSVWNLKEIHLPSGGDIKIEYESDDYRLVQDKKAMQMYTVVGAGSIPNPNDISESNNELTSRLYEFGVKTNQYLYVEIPEPSLPSASNMDKEYNKYVSGLKDNLVQFKFLLNMNIFSTGIKTFSELNNKAKFDFVYGYAKFLNRSDVTTNDQKPCIFQTSSGKFYLSLLLDKTVLEGGFVPNLKTKNPISKAGIEFGRKNLPRVVNSLSNGGDKGNTNGVAITTDFLKSLFNVNTIIGLFDFIAGPNKRLEIEGIGSTFVKKKSFIRLNEPYGVKKGGGSRVKTVRSVDVWEKMNPNQVGYKTMNYGQKYTYTLENDLDNDPLTPQASSGVATYEPIGNSENPHVYPVYSDEKHLLSPNIESFKEAPFGESFFPSPQVTYSRVLVQNLSGEVLPNGKTVKKLHQTGYTVTEFYTTQDYPTIVDQTVFQGENDDTGLLGSLLRVYTNKSFIASQGYSIHLNDMNGKKKSESIYDAQASKISEVVYKYRERKLSSVQNSSSTTSSRNQGRLNNVVPVIYPDGSIKQNTIGVEYDIVNDFRENETHSNTYGAKWNGATFLIPIALVIVPVVLPKYAGADDQFRTVGTTKVINTFGILEETIATQDGATVSTKNLAWDAMTGEVLLTQTTNEYEEPYYTMNYPAHWAYPAMGQAALNVGFEGESNYQNGHHVLKGSALADTYLIEGDEIAYGTGNTKQIGWITSVQGDYFDVIDKDGDVIDDNLNFKVVRSGRRNLQSAGIMNVTLMFNPLLDPSGYVANNPSTYRYLDKIGINYLKAQDWAKYRIINSGAVKYSDVWQSACECSIPENSNPYRYNLRGVWRTKSSHTYLTGRNYQQNTTSRNEGFFTSFSPFYQISLSGDWVQNEDKWTHVSEVSLFSPYGFEMENKDALKRYSSAQYGYNSKLPMAVGANSKYKEIAFDGFEDYDYDGCGEKDKDHFRVQTDNVDTKIDDQNSHTGKHSVLIRANKQLRINKNTSNK